MPDDRSRPQQRGSPDRDSGRLQGSAPPQDSAPAESRLAKQALVLDWDGTVTERDSLHMVIERFGDLEVFDALEEELGGRMTLDEVIGLEMATITAPFDEVVDWLRANVRIRPGFSELVEAHDPLIVSAGFHETIEPILRREGVEARIVANHVTPDPAAGARPSRRRRRARSAASAASAAGSRGSGRSPTPATASPTAVSRSPPTGASRGTASRPGSASRAWTTSRSTTCSTSPGPSILPDCALVVAEGSRRRRRRLQGSAPPQAGIKPRDSASADPAWRAGSSRGSSHTEGGAEDVARERLPGPVDERLHRLDCGSGDLVDRLLDRRERRLCPGRRIDPVEAHDRKIVRDAEPERGRLLHRPDRHQVVGADDGGRPVAARPLDDPVERAPPAFDGERVVGDVRAGVETVGSERLLAPPRLVPGRERERLARDEADPAVAELQQMLGGDAARRALVDPDRRHRQRLGGPVHEDEPGALIEELGVMRMLPADIRDLRAHEDHPLHPPLEEHVDVVDLPHRRPGRVADDRRETGCGRTRLHRLGKGGEHRVAELGHQEADRAARLGAAGRHVEQIAHRALDPLPSLGTDGGGAARDARCGRDTNSRAVGDVSETGGPVVGTVRFHVDGTHPMRIRTIISDSHTDNYLLTNGGGVVISRPCFIVMKHVSRDAARLRQTRRQRSQGGSTC